MIVYRVERVDKVGPYTVGPGTEAQKVRSDPNGTYHPLPHEDTGLRNFDIQQDHHFGFVSMEQLQNWWPARNWYRFVEHNNLHKEDSPERIYGISEYEVPAEHVEVGDKQLVFRMSEAERLIHTPFVTVEEYA